MDGSHHFLDQEGGRRVDLTPGHHALHADEHGGPVGEPGDPIVRSADTSYTVGPPPGSPNSQTGTVRGTERVVGAFVDPPTGRSPESQAAVDAVLRAAAAQLPQRGPSSTV